MGKRELYGWFGKPWNSEVCYEGDRLIEEMHKSFPTGEKCMFCGVLFDEEAGDSGTAIPCENGTEHCHKECLVLTVIGTFGFPNTENMTIRETAVEVWFQLSKRHG